MRLIDANKANKEIKKICNDYGIAYGNNYGGFADKIASVIDDMPIIDSEPVIHGHWVENRDRAELQLICSQCGYDYIEADPDCIERHNFCPHCGAKMNKEAEQE